MGRAFLEVAAWDPGFERERLVVFWALASDGRYETGHEVVASFEEITAELAALPLLCRAAAMRFLLTRLHDWLNTPEDALVQPKDPLEYWRKLRFHRDVAGPGAYGLD